MGMVTFQCLKILGKRSDGLKKMRGTRRKGEWVLEKLQEGNGKEQGGTRDNTEKPRGTSKPRLVMEQTVFFNTTCVS